MPLITLPDGKSIEFPNKVTGLEVAEKISKSLCKRIIEVLNLDESRLKLIGIEGRKNIINKFNVEKMCFSTYSEYKKLLN